MLRHSNRRRVQMEGDKWQTWRSRSIVKGQVHSGLTNLPTFWVFNSAAATTSWSSGMLFFMAVTTIISLSSYGIGKRKRWRDTVKVSLAIRERISWFFSFSATKGEEGINCPLVLQWLTYRLEVWVFIAVGDISDCLVFWKLLPASNIDMRQINGRDGRVFDQCLKKETWAAVHHWRVVAKCGKNMLLHQD